MTQTNPYSTVSTGLSYDSVRKKTLKKLQQLVGSKSYTILHHPPTLYPARQISRLVKEKDLRASYLAPFKAQQTEMVKLCKQANLTVTLPGSNKERCNSYNGECGDDVAEHIMEIYKNQNVSLGLLHSEGSLPCQPGCPFISSSDTDLDQFDVIVGHPVLAHMAAVRESRSIFINGLTGDEFLTEINDPQTHLTPYIRNKTEFSDYRDFIEYRNDPGRGPSIMNYVYGDLKPKETDNRRAIDENGHVHAPMALFGLQYSVELANGWDTTWHFTEYKEYAVETNRYEGFPLGPDRWTIADLDFEHHRVVRKPGETIDEDKIWILRAPDFSDANCVISFDVDPVKRVWNTCYGLQFSLERILDTAESRHFLRNEMDVSVIHTTNDLKPYDGRNVTPGRDVSITLWAGAEFGKLPVIISTKNALEQYDDDQLELLERDSTAHRQYRGYYGPIHKAPPSHHRSWGSTAVKRGAAAVGGDDGPIRS